MNRKTIKYMKEDFIIEFIAYSLVLLAAFIFIYPVVYSLSLSLSSSKFVESQQVWLFPKGFTINAYKLVFEHQYIVGSFFNSVKYTALYTIYALTLTILGAYALSHRELRFNRIISFGIFFTMLFNGGLIPTYLLIRNLHLIDTIWVMIIPLAVSPYNIIVMRTVFQQNPASLEESAKIDGAGYFRILFHIIIPISKPVIATIGLFYMVGAWNDFFKALLYLNTKEKYPLQLIAREIIIVMNDQLMNRKQNELLNGSINFTAMSFRAAVIFVTILPMLVIYPFVQRYFVKGIMIGAIKG